MKKFSLFFSSICIGIMTMAQTGPEIAIIPQPVSLQKQGGNFLLNAQTHIVTENNAEAQRVARLFGQRVRTATGYTMTVQTTKSADKNIIAFGLNAKED